jgi:hypothetical protein
MLHLKAIWDCVRGPVVALLHDDDWWEPHHLEAALRVLNDNATCAATYSSFYHTDGPRFLFQVSHFAWQVWIATKCDFSRQAIVMDDISVLLSCLLNTSFHYSSVVARREAFWHAYNRVVDTGNTYDNDRTFPVFLSEHGPIGYLTRPSVMVRSHAGQDCLRPEFTENHWQLLNNTTKFLLGAMPDKARQAAERFNAEVRTLQRVHWDRYYHVRDPFRSTLIEQCGLNLLPNNHPISVKSILKGLCPPFLWEAARRIAGSA